MSGLLLIASSASGDIPSVRRLLADGIDPNAHDSGGWTALHVAAGLNHVPVVRLLLAAGADPRASNGVGDTPLHLALALNHVEAAEALVSGSSAALLELRNSMGRAPLDCVPSDRRHDIVARLGAVRNEGDAVVPSGGAAVPATA